MNWPSHTDYQDSMQNPEICFQEAELKAGTAACDMLGLPRVLSGNFASVYEIRTPTARWAVRCFVRQVVGQQGRYARLSQYLNSRKLNCLVKFEFILRGVLVKGEWYPIVKMEWVEGLPLNLYIEEHLNEPDTLQKLAVAWGQMLQELRQHNIAHGDLQHGNVMVTPEGELRLVDYDGIYAPVFGRGRSPELGHVNFQHPRRTGEYYEENLDNFSALVIYTSLLALAQTPALWSQYNSSDNLIISSSDYKAPLQSPLFQQLRQNVDTRIPKLVLLLEKSCLAPVERVPTFLEVLCALEEPNFEAFLEKTFNGPLPTPVHPPVAGFDTVMGSCPTPGSGSGSRTEVLGSRPALSHSAAPVAGGREVSRAAQATAPAPAPLADSALNLVGFLAAGLAILTFIPALRLACGVAAAVVGILGLFLTRPNMVPGRWLPLAATLMGIVMAVFARMEQESALPATPAAEETPAGNKPAPASPNPVHAAAGPARLQLVRTSSQHSGPVNTLTFSPAGKFLASGSADKTLRLWDARTGSLKQTFPGHTESVESITFLGDEASLASVTSDNIVRVWDAANGRLKATITDQQNNIWTVTISPNGKQMASGAINRRLIRFLDLQSGAILSTLPEQASWVRYTAFSGDGRLLASEGMDDILSIWEVDTAKLKLSLPIRTNELEVVIFSPDNQLVARPGPAHSVEVWHLQSRQSLKLAGSTGEIRALVFSPNGHYLAAAGDDKIIRLWDLQTGKILTTQAGHEDAIISLAISPDGKVLASGSADHVLKWWDVSSVQPL